MLVLHCTTWHPTSHTGVAWQEAPAEAPEVSVRTFFGQVLTNDTMVTLYLVTRLIKSLEGFKCDLRVFTHIYV